MCFYDPAKDKGYHDLVMKCVTHRGKTIYSGTIPASPIPAPEPTQQYINIHSYFHIILRYLYTYIYFYLLF